MIGSGVAGLTLPLFFAADRRRARRVRGVVARLLVPVWLHVSGGPARPGGLRGLLGLVLVRNVLAVLGVFAHTDRLPRVTVGKSELFTENFLVPIAALDSRRGPWLKLGELWVLTLTLNLAGGALLAVILTSHGVLHPGSADAVGRLTEHLVGYGATTGFISAIVQAR